MPIQIVKIDESIIDYFKMMMDFDNESEHFKEVTENEFKEKLTEALNCSVEIKEIVWIKK
jgi:hypothetical protein